MRQVFSVIIFDVELFRASETEVGVDGWMPSDDGSLVSKFFSFLEGMSDEERADTPLLEMGVDADRPESDGGDDLSILVEDFSVMIEYVRNNLFFLFNDKTKFFDVVGMGPEFMNEKVVLASWRINVPEGLSVENFYVSIVFLSFLPDDELFFLHKN